MYLQCRVVNATSPPATDANMKKLSPNDATKCPAMPRSIDVYPSLSSQPNSTEAPACIPALIRPM